MNQSNHKSQARWSKQFLLAALFVAAIAGCSASVAAPSDASNEPVTLLNVSYDPTRELYAEFNKEFAKHWQEQTGQSVTIEQSHGGSGTQARAVIDGLKADVVTLAIAYDIDQIAEHHEAAARTIGRSGLPNNSCPYTSTIVFLVRKGNPKGIKDWDDLVKAGRRGHHAESEDLRRRLGCNYLAAWGYALRTEQQRSRPRPSEFITALYQERAGARLGRPRLDDDVRATRHRRRAAGLGERSAAGDQGVGPGQVRNGRAVAQHSGRAAGDGRRQERRGARADRSGQGLSRVPLLAGRPEDRGQALLSARASRSTSTRRC